VDLKAEFPCTAMGRDDERYQERDPESGHESKRRKHSHGEEGRSREHERDGKESRGLPHGARELRKDDMEGYRRVFAKYLRDKKDIHIDDISATEAYGRFKSFIHKWYSPSNLEHVQS